MNDRFILFNVTESESIFIYQSAECSIMLHGIRITKVHRDIIKSIENTPWPPLCGKPRYIDIK